MCKIEPLTDTVRADDLRWMESAVSERIRAHSDLKMLRQWDATIKARDERIAKLEAERHRLRVMLNIKDDPDMPR